MKNILIGIFTLVSVHGGLTHAQIVDPGVQTYDVSVKRDELYTSGPGFANSPANFALSIAGTTRDNNYTVNGNETKTYTFPVFVVGPVTRTFKVSYSSPLLNSGAYPLPMTTGGETIVYPQDAGMTNYNGQFGYGVVVKCIGTNQYTFSTTRYECYWCPPIIPTSGTARIPTENKSIPALYPNPGNGYADLVYKASEQEKLTVRITDINGKVISKYTTDLQTGTNRLPVDIRHAASGHYFVSWQSNSGNSGTLKMIKE